MCTQNNLYCLELALSAGVEEGQKFTPNSGPNSAWTLVVFAPFVLKTVINSIKLDF